MKPPFFSACLSIPPSVNHLYGQNGTRRYKLPSVVTYQQLAEIHLLTAWHDAARIDVVRSANTPLAVSIQARLSRGAYQRRDLDNMAKIILDTVLVSYLGIDDSQVADLFLSKRVLEPGAAATLLVQVNESEDFRNDGNNTNIPGAGVTIPGKAQGKRPTIRGVPQIHQGANQEVASSNQTTKKRDATVGRCAPYRRRTSARAI